MCGLALAIWLTRTSWRDRGGRFEGSVDARELLDSLYGPVTLGGMLWSLRVCDEISQAVPATVFVKLALQEQLDRAGVKMSVQVEAA